MCGNLAFTLAVGLHDQNSVQILCCGLQPLPTFARLARCPPKPLDVAEFPNREVGQLHVCASRVPRSLVCLRGVSAGELLYDRAASWVVSQVRRHVQHATADDDPAGVLRVVLAHKLPAGGILVGYHGGGLLERHCCECIGSSIHTLNELRLECSGLHDRIAVNRAGFSGLTAGRFHGVACLDTVTIYAVAILAACKAGACSYAVPARCLIVSAWHAKRGSPDSSTPTVVVSDPFVHWCRRHVGSSRCRVVRFQMGLLCCRLALPELLEKLRASGHVRASLRTLCALARDEAVSTAGRASQGSKSGNQRAKARIELLYYNTRVNTPHA
eukprot:scaffold39376_cov75-Phaeocystis_antarctica.AAC.1